MDWDAKYNNSKIQAALGSVDEVLAAGYKELYRRVFYAYYQRTVFVKEKPVIFGNKTYEPTAKETPVIMSPVRNGVFAPKADTEQMKSLIELAERDLRTAANRLAFLKQPISKAQLILTEAWTGHVQ
jgi:hypothetical protein